VGVGTEKLAELPAHTAWLDGVTAPTLGGVHGLFTVSAAPVLVHVELLGPVSTQV
jgi:hypothetical protein